MPTSILNRNHAHKLVIPNKRIIVGIIKVIRPQFWISTMTASLAGGLIAGTPAKELIPLVIAFALATGGVESFNDFADRFSDSGNIKRGLGIPSSGGTGVIQKNLLTPPQVLKTSIFMCSLGLVFSLFYKWAVFFLGLFILMEIFYSLKPLRLKEKGILGPLAIGIGYGALPFLAGASYQNLALSYLIIALLLIILDFGFGGLAGLADFREDSKNGLKTFSVKYGFWKSKKILLYFELLPFILVLLFSINRIIKVNFLIIITFLFALYIRKIIIKTNPEDERIISNCHILSIIVVSFFPPCFL